MPSSCCRNAIIITVGRKLVPGRRSGRSRAANPNGKRLESRRLGRMMCEFRRRREGGVNREPKTVDDRALGRSAQCQTGQASRSPCCEPHGTGSQHAEADASSFASPMLPVIHDPSTSSKGNWPRIRPHAS